MAKVYIKFPKTGLGNMLLVWAKGVVFAHLNSLPYVTSSWWGFHWGALLRRERKTRLYLGYFKETPFWKRWSTSLYSKFAVIEKEPAVRKLPGSNQSGRKIYLFDKPLNGLDIFSDLREHQALISKALTSILTAEIIKQLSRYRVPVIGVHIRRGDFKIGNQTTPLDYFIAAISLVRETAGNTLPVTVFTDADEAEISALMSLPRVTLSEAKPDILDIILLSKSKYIILSKSSTFGYWAAFLSNAVVVRPVHDWQAKIKDNDPQSGYTEITFDHTNEISAKVLSQRLGSPGK